MLTILCIISPFFCVFCVLPVAPLLATKLAHRLNVLVRALPFCVLSLFTALATDFVLLRAFSILWFLNPHAVLCISCLFSIILWFLKFV